MCGQFEIISHWWRAEEGNFSWTCPEFRSLCAREGIEIKDFFEIVFKGKIYIVINSLNLGSVKVSKVDDKYIFQGCTDEEFINILKDR